MRSTKSCLKRILGKASLNFEELTTILTEVEAVLNSRPLTYIHNELDEPQPLTPAHFLVGNRLTSLPPKTIASNPQPAAQNRETLTKRWKYSQRLLNEFWTHWRRDYLMNLRSAHHCVNTTTEVLNVGDVVLMAEDKMTQQTWKTGKTEDVFLGRDGFIRACSVRTSLGTVLRRPVQLMYPLEISDT